jgi:hypothetical protein
MLNKLWAKKDWLIFVFLVMVAISSITGMLVGLATARDNLAVVSYIALIGVAVSLFIIIAFKNRSFI